MAWKCVGLTPRDCGCDCAAVETSVFHLVFAGDGESCLLFDLFIQSIPIHELDQVRGSTLRARCKALSVSLTFRSSCTWRK